MGMKASEAYKIARDSKEIIRFRERMDKKIKEAACNGEFETLDYIPWIVSDESVKMVVEEYEELGYSVNSEPKENEELAYIDCGNYSERLIRISWKEVKE